MKCNILHVHEQLDDVGVLPGQVADEAFVLKVWPAHCILMAKRKVHALLWHARERVAARIVGGWLSARVSKSKFGRELANHSKVGVSW
jgi:hypothetical protein